MVKTKENHLKIDCFHISSPQRFFFLLCPTGIQKNRPCMVPPNQEHQASRQSVCVCMSECITCWDLLQSIANKTDIFAEAFLMLFPF